MTTQQRQPQADLQPPACIEAEKATLGAILIDGGMLPRIDARCTANDFTDGRHRLIFAAMLALAKRDMAIDYVTVCDQLEGDGKLALAGGPGYLTALINNPPTYVHGEYYARMVHKAAARREIINAVTNIAKDAFNSDAVDTTLAEGKARLAEIERDLNDDDDGLRLRDSVPAYMELLERRYNERDLPKLALPWNDLARLMPYLDAGTLVAVIAEPGAGKTAFMECCAEHWARHGRRVMFFHYELSTQMMLDRRMQRATGIPIRTLQVGGRLSEEQCADVLTASDKIYHWPGDITYVHCPGWPMARVTAAVRKAHELHGCDVAIVDYLNKVRVVDRNGMNSAQLRGQDIEDFKVCLEETGVVGLMAAQFDKAAKRLKSRSLADARDTGELDDKANVGIVIDRPLDEENRRSDTARVSIVKCNAGQEGSVEMVFRGERLMFYPVERVALGGA
jgi:replicative DNA helicase